MRRLSGNRKGNNRERERKERIRVDQTEKQEKGETIEEGGMSTERERALCLFLYRSKCCEIRTIPVWPQLNLITSLEAPSLNTVTSHTEDYSFNI